MTGDEGRGLWSHALSSRQAGPAFAFICCSATRLCLTLCNPVDCSTPGFLTFTISWSLRELMSIESVMTASHRILCPPLLFLPSVFPGIRVFSSESSLRTRWPEYWVLPSVFPSIRVFSNESSLRIRWPEYWSFNVSASPSSEYSGLISFSMDWLDLLAVQGSLKSLVQHHNSKASILWCSAFLIVQFSHLYMTTGKTKALIRQTFVGKVMSLLFNMLSRLVIAFLPRSKRLLISWLQSLSTVIFFHVQFLKSFRQQLSLASGRFCTN